jgi:hypothetical protein
LSSETNPNSRRYAVPKTIAWLSSLHRKGWNNAFLDLNKELMPLEGLRHISKLNPELVRLIEQNLTEWLLADGEINAKGRKRSINEYILSPEGPSLSAEQRDWLQQLGQRPLRLYEVEEVIPGQQFTLFDAVDLDQQEVVVMERSGSRSVKVGDLLGCRILRADDHFEMSGSAFLFNDFIGDRVLVALEEYTDEWLDSLEYKKEFGEIIIEHWLEQTVLPRKIPEMIDSYSGEPIKMIFDLYRVNDEAKMRETLSAQTDVEASEEGWTRVMTCTDDLIRPLVQINWRKKANHIELFSNTQRYADENQLWIKELMGETITFVSRKTSSTDEFFNDPNNASKLSGTKKPAPESSSPIDPATLATLMEKAIHRAYANWADEKIGILDNKTPKQMIKTPKGLERVKKLLLSYETDERQQAKSQGRVEISYEFLWQSLGIMR